MFVAITLAFKSNSTQCSWCSMKIFRHAQVCTFTASKIWVHKITTSAVFHDLKVMMDLSRSEPVWALFCWNYPALFAELKSRFVNLVELAFILFPPISLVKTELIILNTLWMTCVSDVFVQWNRNPFQCESETGFNMLTLAWPGC